MTDPPEPDAIAAQGAEEPPPRRRSGARTLLVGGGVVLLLLVGTALWASWDANDQPAVGDSGANIPKLGDAPPPDKAFALPPATLEGFGGGEEVNLADFRGTPMIVNFWATWCAPCVKEMPEFQAAATEFGDKVQFLGINVEDAPSNAEPYVQRLGIEYPLAIDPRREFYRELGNIGMPTTLLVDAEGIVRYRHTGPLDRAQLKELLRTHLNTPV